MYGSTPAWRDMKPGISKGRDVAQLERNLVDLGYADTSLTVDGSYTSETAAAVRRWQRAHKLSATGEVEHGRVVFMDGARRAGARTADIGSSLTDGTEVMKTSSTTRLVKVELDVAKQSLVHEGDPVTVTLPDGSTAKGRIRSVGRVARVKDTSGDSGGQGGGGGGGSAPELVLDMTVALNSKRGLSRLDEAPVTVNIARETRKRVLAVPVTALLAQAGGGYAVEVVDRAGRRLPRRVDPGLFAGGYVEIDGGLVHEGDRVAVPE
jgi:peptidoglycan hydrolase-like protein with peptidoglycan-binding domain